MVNFRGSLRDVGPRRLFSTGSMPKSSNGKMPYPVEIEVNDNGNTDNDSTSRRERRRLDKEELKFWKAKALKLEGDLEKLEEKLSAIGGGSPATSSASPIPFKMGRRKSSPTAVSDIANQASTPPALSEKAKSDEGGEGEEEEDEQHQHQQRKDEIMQQLVSEMERLIELHTKANGHPGEPVDGDGDGDGNDEKECANESENESENTTGDDTTDGQPGEPAEGDGNDEKECECENECENESENTTGDDTNLPVDGRVNIETSTLEELVSRILASEDGKKKKKKKSHKHKQKHKPKSVLYQLSCKKCIGQNFVGSTKNDLKDKVKENFAVVWQVVQTAYGKGDGVIEGNGHDQSLSFRASSFAHHAAMHCRKCDTEDEVYRWCLRNVKVERISKYPLKRHDSI